MKKATKKSIVISTMNVIVILLLAATVLSFVFINIYSYKLNRENIERYELTYYANKFMDGSAFLTREARAYAATGRSEYYDGYWNEVNIAKNRDKGIAMMKEIGITEEEEAMVDEMIALSNALIPLEAEAMDLAAAGDTQGALDIVYGDYYCTSIDNISEMRDEFLAMLSARTTADVGVVSAKYTVINVVAWCIVMVILFLQLIQKRSLHFMAYVDPLTKGDNYMAFKEKMRGGIGVSGSGYVVSADLRGFSTINDTCGIAKGDEVIHDMGKVLEDSIVTGELSAHVSGDMFVLFLHSESWDALIERISVMRTRISELSSKLDVPHVVPLFGIREVESPLHPESAYSDANLSKQQVKDRIDRFYSVYAAETRQAVVEDQKMEDGFAAAIAEEQFEMWFQPKMSPTDGKMVAAEALMRWKLPDGTILYPESFTPLFERNGMIAQLDEYAFDRVCSWMRKWMDEGRSLIPVSVNVSRVSLLYPDIVKRYIDIANRHGVPKNCLELEITESAVDGNEDVEEKIRLLRSRGFRILMDNFGRGYSSFHTLTKDYFDAIKIDNSIVECINTPEGDVLMESIIRLAHQFDMTVTAEGVEEKYQVDFLIGLDCDIIQGFYYSEPQPPDEFFLRLKFADAE